MCFYSIFIFIFLSRNSIHYILCMLHVCISSGMAISGLWLEHQKTSLSGDTYVCMDVEEWESKLNFYYVYIVYIESTPSSNIKGDGGWFWIEWSMKVFFTTSMSWYSMPLSVSHNDMKWNSFFLLLSFFIQCETWNDGSGVMRFVRWIWVGIGGKIVIHIENIGKFTNQSKLSNFNLKI